ncbi:MAG: hypothetical protein PF482_02770 [Desulfobacteraceae bacterium]|jgi:hypothetical protein|nr:hypothetical protein [Desulfobacteraceae bacterium]
MITDQTFKLSFNLNKLKKPGETITVIEGVRETSLSAGIIDEKTFNQGIKALNRTAEPDGIFCYTFFKAVAIC